MLGLSPVLADKEQKCLRAPDATTAKIIQETLIREAALYKEIEGKPAESFSDFACYEKTDENPQCMIELIDYKSSFRLPVSNEKFDSTWFKLHFKDFVYAIYTLTPETVEMEIKKNKK